MRRRRLSVGARVVGPRAAGTFFYDEGDLESDWVEGHSEGSGSVSKQSDHLRMDVDGTGGDTRSWVTSAQKDLSGFDKLVADIAIESESRDSRANVEVDVSGFSGSKYVSVQTVVFGPIGSEATVVHLAVLTNQTDDFESADADSSTSDMYVNGVGRAYQIWVN